MTTPQQTTVPLADLLKKITPLPWRADERHVQYGNYGIVCGTWLAPDSQHAIVNAVYLAHAASVLPQVVEALEACQNALDRLGLDESTRGGQALLKVDAALAAATTVKLS